MKNSKIGMLISGTLLCFAMTAIAQEKTRDEKNLDRAAMEVEKDAGKPAGGETVTAMLKNQFGVDDARVQGLRDQKLGYGEVSIVLSLAQNLPGGINDANVQKIMALRQGPPVMGWGKVAKELGLNLGQVVSKVKRVSAEARKKEAGEKAKAAKAKGGSEEKGGKGDMMDKPERHEKMERQEHGGRPEKAGRK